MFPFPALLSLRDSRSLRLKSGVRILIRKGISALSIRKLALKRLQILLSLFGTLRHKLNDLLGNSIDAIFELLQSRNDELANDGNLGQHASFSDEEIEELFFSLDQLCYFISYTVEVYPTLMDSSYLVEKLANLKLLFHCERFLFAVVVVITGLLAAAENAPDSSENAPKTTAGRATGAADTKETGDD